jgi:LysM repeat protein/RNA polymerase subunit RPABC4/transcription elongation factor Spt4
MHQITGQSDIPILFQPDTPYSPIHISAPDNLGTGGGGIQSPVHVPNIIDITGRELPPLVKSNGSDASHQPEPGLPGGQAPVHNGDPTIKPHHESDQTPGIHPNPAHEQSQHNIDRLPDSRTYAHEQPESTHPHHEPVIGEHPIHHHNQEHTPAHHPEQPTHKIDNETVAWQTHEPAIEVKSPHHEQIDTGLDQQQPHHTQQHAESPLPTPYDHRPEPQETSIDYRINQYRQDDLINTQTPPDRSWTDEQIKSHREPPFDTGIQPPTAPDTVFNTDMPTTSTWSQDPDVRQIALDTQRMIEETRKDPDFIQSPSHDYGPRHVDTNDTYGDKDATNSNNNQQTTDDQNKDDKRKTDQEIERLSDTMLTPVATRNVKDEIIAAKADRVWEEQQREQQRQDELNRQDNYQPKYVVKADDTLEGIAIKKIGAIDAAELIYDLNKSRIAVKIVNGKKEYIVKPGTILIMPSKKQIRQWKQQRLSQSANTHHASQANFQRVHPEPENPTTIQRRSNIEKLLGPIKAALKPNTDYTVRLGDTLRSIAMKHPILNDVNLWQLLAEKNNLPLTCDSRGTPSAQLRRGSKLIMPTAEEIADFFKSRSEGIAPVPPAPTVLELASKECPGCRRLITKSSTVCPACAFSFSPEIWEDSAPMTAISDDQKATVKSSAIKHPTLSDNAAAATPTSASAAQDSPSTVVVGTDRRIADRAGRERWDQDDPRTVLNDSGTGGNTGMSRADKGDSGKDRSLLFADNETQILFNRSNLSIEPPKPDNAIHFNTPETLLFGRINNEVKVRSAGNSHSSPEVILQTEEQVLVDGCKLKNCTIDRGGIEISRSQLLIERDGRWIVALSYELSEKGSMRHETLPGGGVNSMKIDLPLALAADMVRNDLSSNWSSYMKKFLASKKLSI